MGRGGYDMSLIGWEKLNWYINYKSVTSAFVLSRLNSRKSKQLIIIKWLNSSLWLHHGSRVYLCVLKIKSFHIIIHVCINIEIFQLALYHICTIRDIMMLRDILVAHCHEAHIGPVNMNLVNHLNVFLYRANISMLSMPCCHEPRHAYPKACWPIACGWGEAQGYI